MCYAYRLLINSKDKNRFSSGVSLCVPRSEECVFVFSTLWNIFDKWAKSLFFFFSKNLLLKEWKISDLKKRDIRLLIPQMMTLITLAAVASSQMAWPQLRKRSRSVAAGESESALSSSQVSWWHWEKVRFTTSEAGSPAVRGVKLVQPSFWGWVKCREQMLHLQVSTESQTLWPWKIEPS